MPARRQLRPLFEVVEQLAIENHEHVPLLVGHRLLAIREADDAQPARRQRDARPVAENPPHPARDASMPAPSAAPRPRAPPAFRPSPSACDAAHAPVVLQAWVWQSLSRIIPRARSAESRDAASRWRSGSHSKLEIPARIERMPPAFPKMFLTSPFQHRKRRRRWCPDPCRSIPGACLTKRTVSASSILRRAIHLNPTIDHVPFPASDSLAFSPSDLNQREIVERHRHHRNRLPVSRRSQ